MFSFQVNGITGTVRAASESTAREATVSGAAVRGSTDSGASPPVFIR